MAHRLGTQGAPPPTHLQALSHPALTLGHTSLRLVTGLFVVGGREGRSHLLGELGPGFVGVYVCVCIHRCVHMPLGRAGSTGKGSVRCSMVLSAGRVCLDCELEGRGPKPHHKIPFSKGTARALSRGTTQSDQCFISLSSYILNFIYF